MFDNCFKIVEGPDAPNLTFQELDKELILYLTNPKSSNNYNEGYVRKNPFIAIPDTMDGVYQGTEEDKDTLKVYEFQGYQIFQVKNASVTVAEIYDVNVSRLLAQVDIKDGVGQLINHVLNAELGVSEPKLMVQGADEGIKHSFRVTSDLFATDDSRLINHRSYHYIAIAYGHNEYKKYDPSSPVGLDGQKVPYIASRKMAGGRGITAFSAIPHNPAPENGGTLANSEYGDMPQITRVDGQGNGGNNLDITSSTEASIVANGFKDNLIYKVGKGPIQVKVIDPLNVRAGKYRVQFVDTNTVGDLTDAFWTIHLPQANELGQTSINSDQSIEFENEQILLTEGLAVTIGQVVPPGVNRQLGNGVLTSEIVYSDPSLQWLGGFSDEDSQSDQNWIRSGENLFGTGQAGNSTYVLDPYDDYHSGAIASPSDFMDPNQDFENLIDGTWAPYRMVSCIRDDNGNLTPPMVEGLAYMSEGFNSSDLSSNYNSDITKTPSVDIVFTSDKSKWSRSVVLESRNDTILSEGATPYLRKRNSNSVDKNGVDDGTGTGMGWFPGYAINVETGERLNIVFAEDSWLAGENGRDMQWNPTSTSTAGVNNELVLGGKHYVYVFRSNAAEGYPAYDECKMIDSLMSLPINGANGTQSFLRFQDAKKAIAIWEKSCVWAGIPMVNPGRSLLETTAKIKLRVERPYESYATTSLPNGGLPMYEFDMTGFEVETGNEYAMDSALALINVVPNPYFAYSEYETNKLDKRIKITNLPKEC
ncbi:T9SS C-terminal target domain-containing protein, partial [Vicingaceae bacterium]|nr:T9SS C-terminal target domain-containing protein [Vicingaceae bacterium]